MTFETRMQDAYWAGYDKGYAKALAITSEEEYQKLKEQEHEERIRWVVELFRKHSRSREEARDIVTEKFQLSPEEAERKVSQYW